MLLGVAFTGYHRSSMFLFLASSLLEIVDRAAADFCLYWVRVVGHKPGVLKVFRGEDLCGG
jgi:hypothetical protein